MENLALYLLICHTKYRMDSGFIYISLKSISLSERAVSVDKLLYISIVTSDAAHI